LVSKSSTPESLLRLLACGIEKDRDFLFEAAKAK
jgi:hypothetical protein